MSRAGLVVLVVALLILAPLTAGAAIVLPKVITEEQRRVRRALRAGAARAGASPRLLDIIDALGYVESRWKVSAVNRSGADGARGGAHGPTQITELTARGHGYAGSMDALRSDAALAGEWTARILRKRPGGEPTSIEDASAWWNAGRATLAAVPQLTASGKPHPTRADYVPKAVAALQLVKGSPA